jgi:hypothetical protein
MTITKVTDAGLDRSRIVTPIIINGDMSIAQRATSATGKTGAGIYTVDRMRLSPGGGMTFTVAQASESPTGEGFTKSYKLTSTTGDSSMSSSEYNIPLQMRMEGNVLQSIRKGTSNAQKITFAFWVYATVTGTYVLELSDDDNSRYNSQSYTISSANTWEKKIVTFPADTTGAFDNDNAKSLTINFWGGAGSNFSSGTLQTTWTSGTDANRAAGQVNAFASNNNVWQITGLQLEIGEFDANLDGNTTTRLGGVFAFNTTMRAAPSVTKTNNTGTIDSQTITDKGYSVFAEKTDRATTTNVTDIELDSEL